MHPDLCEVGVLGIDEPVRFSRSENRRHDENGRAAVADKSIAEYGETRRRGTPPPIYGQALCGDGDPRNTAWNIRGDYHQILRRIVRVDVDEIFDHGER